MKLMKINGKLKRFLLNDGVMQTILHLVTNQQFVSLIFFSSIEFLKGQQQHTAC